MLIILKNEAGETEEQSFESMDEAAKWCIKSPEYGITLYPENSEPEWDYTEWQALLDYYA